MIAHAAEGEGRTRSGAARSRGRLRESQGHTLVELLAVLSILSIVLGSLTGIFLSGSKAQVNMTKRFDAQSNGRLALDGLRREIHCASAITTNGVTPVLPADFPRSKIVITISDQCPSADLAISGDQQVTWCTRASGAQFALWRTHGTSCTMGAEPVQKADHLTTGEVFKAYAAGELKLDTLTVQLPVDADPNATGGVYKLEDDIVLRNTPRR